MKLILHCRINNDKKFIDILKIDTCATKSIELSSKTIGADFSNNANMLTIAIASLLVTSTIDNAAKISVNFFLTFSNILL